jgi:hypothetical protein
MCGTYPTVLIEMRVGPTPAPARFETISMAFMTAS